MAGWKLRKDKTQAETPDVEAPDAAETPQTEAPQTEAVNAEAPGMAFEAATHARSYDLSESAETKEPGFLDAVPSFSSFDSEPEVHFMDMDFDSDPEDLHEASKTGYSNKYPDKYPEHGDSSLTLVDYTEAVPTPPEFILQGPQIFEMPPPEIEMPAAIEMPLPAVEAPSFLEAAPTVIEALPPVSEVLPPAEAEEAPKDDFPERLRTGRFGRDELAPAPALGIPTVSPFVLDTPLPAAPPAAPPQLVVRVGRLSAPFALAKDVTTIGRPDSALHYYPDVEIELDDAVSRRHAEVVKRGDSYYLVDTGSTNGTLLNGEKLPPQEERLLAYGDRIRVGDRTEITFE